MRWVLFYFGFLSHSSQSVTLLFRSDTLEEALALFFTRCIDNVYTRNDAHLRLIKCSSMSFPETSCYDRELVICGYNLQPENYLWICWCDGSPLSSFCSYFFMDDRYIAWLVKHRPWGLIDPLDAVLRSPPLGGWRQEETLKQSKFLSAFVVIANLYYLSDF